MNFRQIVETLLNDVENFFERLFEQYFSGEWTVPWLPDDL